MEGRHKVSHYACEHGEIKWKDVIYKVSRNSCDHVNQVVGLRDVAGRGRVV